jgi:hypothetical protein
MPKCHECQGELSFVCSWTFRGRWGYDEVLTFECPAHGPIFVSPRTPMEQSSEERAESAPDSDNRGDRDSLVSAPRKPTPTLDADAIAIPEPE